MSEWRRDILNQLEELERKQNAVPMYQTLVYWKKERADSALRYEALKSDSVVADLDGALNRIRNLEEEIDSARILIKEKEAVNNDLIVAYGAAKQDKEVVREMYRKLEEKYGKLQEEMAMNKKMIDTINDHILELEMENNILNMGKH